MSCPASRTGLSAHSFGWLTIALALCGCNPSAFDALANRADAAAKRDSGTPEPDAARDDGSTRDATADPRDAAADGGEPTDGGDTAPDRGGGAGGRGGADHAGESGGTAGMAGMSAAGSGGSEAGAPGPAPCEHANDLTKVALSVSEFGALSAPSWAKQRTAASTATVQDRVLIVFSIPGGFGMAGWGTAAALLSSPPHLEEQPPFVPLFESSAIPSDRSLSVGSAVAIGDSALVYFASAQGFFNDAAGLARVARNGAQAEVLRSAGALFPAPMSGSDPAPWRPAFISGAVAIADAGTEYVYVYGCQPNPNNPDEQQSGAHEGPCRLARVPRSDVAMGERYRYWSGTDWVDDVSRAAIVLDHAPSGLSVSHNDYLGKYLAVHSGPWNTVVLRWADRPEGPWQALGQFNTITATGGFGTTFGAIEVPMLRDSCQRVLSMIYSSTQNATQPDGTTTLDFSSRLVRVEFR
jgi:hypothetical protein